MSGALMRESDSVLDAPVIGSLMVQGVRTGYWSGMTMREVLVLGELPDPVRLAQFRYAWTNRDVVASADAPTMWP